ncbi:hypothetical protein BX667DRAFT_500784 [Coemansia mojavensis]|nr:hypothetical protein BX667DRAFT_500784 [Coemansia mojavensis]
MPNIRHLRVHGNGWCADALACKMFTTYLPQLKGIYNGVAAPICISSISDQLSHLQIRAGLLAASELPCTFTNTLRYLDLSDVSSLFSWSIFNTDLSQDKLIFPNLHHLSLSFSENLDESPSSSKYTLHPRRCRAQFPSLDYLQISLHPRNNPLLSECVLPAHIRTVRIVGCVWPPNMFHRLAINNLQVSLSTDDFQITDKLVFANCLFGNQCAAQHTWLQLNHALTTAEISQVEWTQLKRLSILRSIHAWDILLLLSSATNISVLTVADINCTEIENYSTDILYSEAQLMAGLSRSKLEVLCIKGVEHSEAILQLIDCLVRLLPDLQKILYPV